jgi:hypothetical protein
MLIYNTSALQDPQRERIASVQWSRDGQQAVLYLDGSAQALIDFAARQSYCRSNFPNFLEEDGQAQGGGWHRGSHAWDDAALQRFESGIYA